MKERSFDVVILGAGPGGYVAAIRAAQLGLTVAVIEKDTPGGVCLNIGCIPSKALIHQATLFHEGKALLERTGAKVDISGFDYSKVWRSSRLAADRLSKGVQFLLKKNKVELIKGFGILSDSKSILVDNAGEQEIVRGKALILATGSRPRSIPGFMIDEKTLLSSTGILMSDSLPSSLIILGAGAIGMEFAYVMNAFGVDVTVVELLDQVLPLEDSESAKIVEKAFVSRGVKIHTSAKAEKVTASGGKALMSVVLGDGSSATLEADRVLISVGRSPNTEGLGLESLGIRMTRGYVETGDYYETQAAGIYAIGDITTQPQLAHVASKAGEIAVEHIAHLLKGSPEARTARINPYVIPSAVYCEPEVASFGLSEKKAGELGVRFELARFPYRGIGKAVATEAPEGQVKIVFSPTTGAILGASIVGAGATDTIHELLLASETELTLEEVGEMIHAHPTLSEGIMEAAKAGLGRAIHI
ncbi:MAG: dihydrolipoyl dehydrogenase [Rectinemataceae bacterium]|nr:dihydrolipoyl dehydrogenase [Rectinemataceae bacterium]